MIYNTCIDFGEVIVYNIYIVFRQECRPVSNNAIVG